MKNLTETIATPTPPKSVPQSRGPRLPRQFVATIINTLGSETSGFGYAESCRQYGLWKCRVLIDDCQFFYESPKFMAGDVVNLPGNVAVFAALHPRHIVEFVDERLEEEEKVLAEAARLGVPLPARDNPAFNFPFPDSVKTAPRKKFN